MNSWTGRLPHYSKRRDEMTDDELLALHEFRLHELDTEWCATLILPDLRAIEKELARRGVAVRVDNS